MNLANRITMLRIALIPVCIICMMVQTPLFNFIAALVFIVAALTDILDGHIARTYHQVTMFGKFIDPIADKLLVTSAMVMLVEQQKIPAVIVIIIMAREFIISGYRLVASAQGKVIAASSIGKAKTFIQMAAIIVIMLDNYPFSLIRLPMDDILIYLALILTVWSALDYILRNRGVFSPGGKKDDEH